MNKNDFLNDIKTNCSQIVYLCAVHIAEKIYADVEEIDEEENKTFFSNYKNYHQYLNDYAGVIYNKHGSHINTVYIEMCQYLKIEVDNQYTLEYTIAKLEKQTPELLLGLTIPDIQVQTIEHFDEKLVAIKESTYYKENLNNYFGRVEKLSENIKFVKRALNL